MNKRIFYCVVVGVLPFLSACDNNNEDKVKEISKDGSIETMMSVEHIGDKLDVIKTTHKIWVKNMLVKTAVHNDTIPALGIVKTETETTESSTRQIDVKKDYEFYITVK
jgi:hypothetical protein